MHPQKVNIDDLIQKYIQEGIRMELEKRNSPLSLSRGHYTIPISLSSPLKAVSQISPTALWLPPVENIDDLYYPLKNEYKIKCELLVIQTLFLRPELITEPILWYGLDNEFACVFGKLKNRNLIKKSNYWKFICEKFFRADGTSFCPRSLSSQFAQNKFSAEFDEFVDCIIATIKGAKIKVNSG